MGLKIEEYTEPKYTEETVTAIVQPEPEISSTRTTTQKNSKEIGATPGIKAFFNDQRFRWVLGTIFLLVATYLLISCIAYFASGSADQSAVDNNSIMENAQAHSVENMGGPLGAYLSEFFFNKGFGIGTFCLIYMLFALGLKSFERYKYRITSTILISLVGTITLSSMFGFIELITGNRTFFALGGAHGHTLNAFCNDVAGPFGCVALNILLIVILIVLTINSLKHVYAHLKEYMVAYQLRKLEKKKEEEDNRRNTFDGAQSEHVESKPTTVGPELLDIKKYNNSDEEIDYTDSNNEVFGQSEYTTEETIETVELSTNESLQGPDDNEESQDSNSIYSQLTGKIDTPHTIEAEQPTAAQAAEMKEIQRADTILDKPFDPTAELSRYKFPPTSLLKTFANNGKSVDIEEQEENKAKITKTLNDFGIGIKSIEVCVGPTVTLYEIIPADGTKIARIKTLEDDIALRLAALGIRIIAPIPGKGTVGIEVPNRDKRTVSMKDIVESKKFQECNYELPIAIGCTISNDIFIADLTKMPHVLVAGATGMGKSVGLNAIVTSLLYKKHPAELKFVMIDPKMVEFSMYARMKYHYIAQMEGEDDCIVTDMNKAVATLNSLVEEMENRLVLLLDANVRNIKEYNAKFVQRKLNPEKGHKFMPYIVVIIDELADLIMNIGRREVEKPIARITQKARAVGIHMILATQRPSTDIITGLIKNNCPGRIAFRVTQMVDSRTILDRKGAEQLIGYGDMLISNNNELTRVQCAFVDTPEVEAIADYVESQIGYDMPYMLPLPKAEGEETSGNEGMGTSSERDTLFEDVARAFIKGTINPSTSSIQRSYSIGYNRAGRLMDQLVDAGVVSKSQGGKPRQILMDEISLQAFLNN